MLDSIGVSRTTHSSNQLVGRVNQSEKSTMILMRRVRGDASKAARYEPVP